MSQIKYITLTALLSACYFITAKIGLLFAFEQANASSIWPSTGLAIAMLLYFGYRCWPAIFIGATLINFATHLPLTISLLIGLGNSAEALVACWLILRFSNPYPFDSVRSVVIFIGVLLVATLISPTIGVSSLIWGDIVDTDAFRVLWLTWWLGDLVGGIIVTPLLLTFLLKRHIKFSLLRLGESLLLILCAILSAGLVFIDWPSLTITNHSLSFLIMPTIIWAALRFYQQGAMLIIIFYISVAVATTIDGSGPFVSENINNSLITLQMFMAIIAITALALAANLDEKLQAQKSLNKAHNNLEQQVFDRTIELEQTNDQLKLQVERRQQSTDSMERLLEAAYLPSDTQYYHAITKELVQIYQCHFAFIGVFTDSSKTAIRTLSLVVGGQIVDNFSYDLLHTPCKDVLNQKIETIPCNATQLYPNDQLLIQMGVESYFGAPLLTPAKDTLGIAVIMDTKPMHIGDWVKPILGLMANRISIELEREKSKEEIKLAASVFKETVEAIVICDHNKRILRVNPAFTELTGYTIKETTGQSLQLLTSNKNSAHFYQTLWREVELKGTWQGEIWHSRANGETFPCWLTITLVKDNQGRVKQYIEVFSDISTKKAAEDQIYHLAHFDGLTNLPNRTLFIEQLNNALMDAQANQQQLGLIFMDLDHFKLVNDASGHFIGDILLTQVADRLRPLINDDLVVSRFGGDEFTILLKNLESDHKIEQVAATIAKSLAEPFTLDCMEVIISSSIGLCVYPTDATNAHEMLKNADIAMYKAKNSGRKNIKRFTSEMDHIAKQRVAIEHQLRIALKQNQFVLHYQPQVQLSSGHIIGVEVLVRWNHPQQGLIAPNDFIPIAEESGLIVPLGYWILEAACRQFVRWQQQGIHLNHVAVNLSARQFNNYDLASSVKRILQQTGMKPAHLELELTESMLMEKVDLTIATMHKLSALGIQLSIDDFGTGYSSLAYLKHFPIDKLKIDKSFIDDLLTDAKAAAIVKTTINLAHGLGLIAIAEGVETVEQANYLKAHHCEEIQGYYFSRPHPADSVVLAALFSQYSINEVDTTAVL